MPSGGKILYEEEYMDPAPPTWPTRLLRTLPPMSDGAWLGFMVLIVFMIGIAVGQTWCMYTKGQEFRRSSIQFQLDTFDKRLKALESR